MQTTTILHFIIAVVTAGIASNFIHIFYGHLVAGITMSSGAIQFGSIINLNLAFPD